MKWKNEQTVTAQIAFAIHDALIDARDANKKQLLEARLNFYTLAMTREQDRIQNGDYARRFVLRWLETTAKDIWLQIIIMENA